MADTLKKVLTEYGVDMKKTMERFVGDEDLYAECLTKFLSDSSCPACPKINIPVCGIFLSGYIISLFYFLISKDFPVISAGCSIPISSIIVGMISARHPSSFKV